MSQVLEGKVALVTGAGRGLVGHCLRARSCWSAGVYRRRE